MSEIETTPEARGRLMEMLYGPWCAALNHLIASLDLADLMRDGPQALEDLARATATRPDVLYRLLRAATATGVLREHADARFSLSEIGQLLRSDVDDSLRGAAILCGDPMYWRLFVELTHVARSGENAFEHVYGMPCFDYLAKDADAATRFGEGMHALLSDDLPGLVFSLVSRYDLAAQGKVVDVGGGVGGLLTALLEVVDDVRGVLFDMPSILPRARQRFEAAGVADRCDLIGGSFFDEIPSGAGMYLIRRVLCDWKDELAVRILRNCRNAMGDDASLVLIDSVLVPLEHGSACLTDVQLMLCLGGRERTEEDWKMLLEASGFELTGVFPTLAKHCLIEARPVTGVR